MTKIEYALSISEGEYKEEDIIKDFCPSDFFMKEGDTGCFKKESYKPIVKISKNIKSCKACWNSIKEG